MVSNKRSLLTLALVGILHLLAVLSVLITRYEVFGSLGEKPVLLAPLSLMLLSVVALFLTSVITSATIARTGVRMGLKVAALVATLFSVLGEAVVEMSSDGSIGPGLLPLFGIALHSVLGLLLVFGGFLLARPLRHSKAVH